MSINRAIARFIDITHEFVKALFFLFVFLIPFQISFTIFSGSDIALSRIFAVPLFLGWLFLSLKKRKVFIPQGLTGVFLFAFLFWSALSLSFAPQTNFALRKLVFLLNFSPLFLMTPSIISSKEDEEMLIKVLICSALCATLLGIAQFFSQFIWGLEPVFGFFATIAPLIYGINFSQSIIMYNSWLVNVGGQTLFRAIALFPDPHIFGFYLAFVTPLALFSPRKLYKFFGALCLLALVFTFSRAAYIGALGAFFVYGAFRVKRLGVSSKLPPPIRYMLYAMPFLIVLLLSPAGLRLLSSLDVSEGSAQGRLAIWSQAASIIKEHPLVGVGLGNYAFAIDPASDYRKPIYAHNLYLDIWAELGIVGLLLWLCAIGHSLYSCLFFQKRHWAYSALFVSLLWFSLQAFFDTPLFSVHILPLLMIFFSLHGVPYEIHRV